MHLAGAVADDEGRAVVGLGLVNGLEGLSRVGAHGDLRHVDVAVAHGDLGQGLLLGHLTGSGELSDLAQVRGLGGLAAGVGVDLGVEDEDVDVVARSQDVVQATEADVVGPAVAAEDPEGLLGEVSLVGEDRLGSVAAALLELGNVGSGSGLGGLGVVDGVNPSLAGGLELIGRTIGSDDVLGSGDQLVLNGLIANGHAQTVLGIVLEQGVVPRRAVTVLVLAVRSGGSGVAPNGGAAGGVGNEHAVAGDLGHQTCIGGLGAAGAGAGELQVGLLKLAALDVGRDELLLLGDVLDHVVPNGLLVHLLLGGNHLEGALGANLDAVGATHAVERGHGHGELHALGLGAHGVERAGSLGCGGSLVLGHRERTDGGMRAHIGALVALDALGLVPVGNDHSDAALLVCGGAQLKLAVGAIDEGGNRQAVAVHAIDGLEQVLDLLGDGGLGLLGELDGGGILGGSPVGRNLELTEGGSAGIDGLVVGVDDSLALLHVGLGSRVLHVLQGVLGGQDLGQREEGGLEHRVGALAHADLGRQVDSVDQVDVDVVVRDVALGHGGHVLGELLVAPLAVDQEGAARLDVADHLEALNDVAGVMAGDKVGLGHVVRRTDRRITKAQVRDGDAAGLLGVVLEVGLDVLVGVVADDLNRVLVGADGTVATQTPELALDGAGGCGVGRILGLGQAQVGHVIDNADGELALGLVLLELLEDSERGRGRRILAAQAITAADDLDARLAGLVESGDDVLVERLADRTRLLGTVHDGDLLDGLGENVDKVLDGERTEQTNLDQADLLAVSVEVVDDFLEHVAEGAHAHDDAIGIGSAVVVEQAVIGAELLVDLLHVALDDGRKLVVDLVAGLAVLEEDVAVLVATAGVRVLRVERVIAESLDGVHVAHLGQILVVPHGDLLDLVAGAEAVEEVKERGLALDGGKVSHRREVHDLLDVALGEHGEAGLTAGHDVGVIAKDVQGVGSDATRGDVEDARELLACDLVHVRDHQEQALRSRVGGGQSTGAQRTVNGTGCTSLGLHLDDLDRGAEDVLATLGRPLVDMVGHRAGRRNGIDSRYLGVRIRNICGRLVAVHRLKLTRHIPLSSHIGIQAPAIAGMLA